MNYYYQDLHKASLLIETADNLIAMKANPTIHDVVFGFSQCEKARNILDSIVDDEE